jgi:hypothetical protein
MPRRPASVEQQVADLVARIEKRHGRPAELYTRFLHDPDPDASPEDRANEPAVRLLYPPAAGSAVAAAEKELGLALPPLLRAVYTWVGNGGWCLRLMGVPGGQTGFEDWFRGKGLAAARRLMIRWWPKFSGDPWPATLVPIFDGSGCGMIEHVDCSTPEGRVWRTDSGYLTELYPSLWDYLRAAVAAG